MSTRFLIDIFGIRRRPTLPGRFQPSTIGAMSLNFCVRDGNRWCPHAIVTGNCFCFSEKLFSRVRRFVRTLGNCFFLLSVGVSYVRASKKPLLLPLEDFLFRKVSGVTP